MNVSHICEFFLVLSNVAQSRFSIVGTNFLIDSFRSQLNVCSVGWWWTFARKRVKCPILTVDWVTLTFGSMDGAFMALRIAKQKVLVAQKQLRVANRGDEKRIRSDWKCVVRHPRCEALCKREFKIYSPIFLMLYFPSRDKSRVNCNPVILSGVYKFGKLVKDNDIMVMMSNTELKI